MNSVLLVKRLSDARKAIEKGDIQRADSYLSTIIKNRDDLPAALIPECREVQLLIAERVFEHGNWSALLDALRICATAECPLPPWLHHALNRVIREHLLKVKTKKRGRHSRWIVQWRDDLRDFERYTEIRTLRLRKDFCVEEGDHLNWPGAEALGADDRLFGTASNRLRLPEGPETIREIRADDKPSARTVRSSYLRVRRRLETEPWRYYRGPLARAFLVLRRKRRQLEE